MCCDVGVGMQQLAATLLCNRCGFVTTQVKCFRVLGFRTNKWALLASFCVCVSVACQDAQPILASHTQVLLSRTDLQQLEIRIWIASKISTTQNPTITRTLSWSHNQQAQPGTAVSSCV